MAEKMKIKVKCVACGEVITIASDEKAVMLLDAVTACPVCGSNEIKKIGVEKKAAKEKDPLTLSYAPIEIKDEFGDSELAFCIKLSAYDRIAFRHVQNQMKDYPGVKYSVTHQGWVTYDETEAKKVVLLIDPNPTKEQKEAIKAARKAK